MFCGYSTQQTVVGFPIIADADRKVSELYDLIHPNASSTHTAPRTRVRTVRIEVAPALSWRATVLSVKELPVGALIGYGGMFRTVERTRVATLAAGYADGVPHKLSNRGSVIANGKLVPILGAVSMDMMSVDVTTAPEIQVGDAVTLLGAEGDVRIDSQQIAKVAGTISYSVLCGIHARVKRVYL